MNDLVKYLPIRLDEQADAAYIYLRHPLENGAVKQTLPITLPASISSSINLDFDDAGRLIGIEVLGIQQGLPEGFLSTTTLA